MRGLSQHLGQLVSTVNRSSSLSAEVSGRVQLKHPLEPVEWRFECDTLTSGIVEAPWLRPRPSPCPQAQQLVRNLTALRLNLDEPANQPLQLPNAYHFMPHLLDGPAGPGSAAGAALRPAYCMCSARRSGVSMVLGVPTVRRQVQSYLLATLDNLVASMTPDESNDTLIVVFVAEVRMAGARP